ncbi:keratin-associated protein 19-2-like [Panonychus citri]|uniref:keratin-associated protein 19-2-like n=1 Tax=Panonychus citri TaxID=50023 RepID=UPI0023075D79|nr:keratin-associated protein 19-2-like [Panonychus citri]
MSSINLIFQIGVLLIVSMIIDYCSAQWGSYGSGDYGGYGNGGYGAGGYGGYGYGYQPNYGYGNRYGSMPYGRSSYNNYRGMRRFGMYGSYGYN